MHLAIIIARGGSKRIPRKNIKPFLGKPMITYAIETARAVGLFEHLVVSTEDEETAQLARQCGAEVPFIRPLGLSDDRTGTDEVLVHAVGECRRLYGDFRYGCCIYPANPFLQVCDLRQGFALIKDREATSAFPVVKYDFPIEQALALEGARPVARWPEQLARNSQEFPDHYHDAGSFYWFDVEKFMLAGGLFGENAVVFPIPAERCQDINTPDDWTRAELKYRILTQQARA
jgi:pseudaminic acid cytidylyltransferase